MKYVDIVFMQGQGAEEALSLLDPYGWIDKEQELALLHYLQQWDNCDGGGFARTTPPNGTSDSVVVAEGYHLTYNTRLGYCGLCRIEQQ